MTIVANQQRTFLHLLAQLRPHWCRDPALPARIQSLLTSRREFGSRDRRLYRELIYTTLRHLPWVEPWLDRDPAEAVRRVAWLAADVPATAAFRAALATGDAPTGERAELLPAWFREHCPAVFTEAELEAQARRAPLWLRLQTSDSARVFAEFDALGWISRPASVLPDAIELLGEVDVTKTSAWQAGQIEVQDLGSQLLLETIGIERGCRWLDACAGAGGKALQLARLIGSDGRVDAHDIRPAALAELEKRAARAGIAHIHTTQQTRAGLYDGVLVDAPCSGSGTWRRSPHLKWTTTPAQIAACVGRQLAILTQFAPSVRPGGRLVYATCSLSRRENEDVVERFLGEHREFQPAPLARDFGFPAQAGHLTILPGRHNTDGFFVASLRRR